MSALAALSLAVALARAAAPAPARPPATPTAVARAFFDALHRHDARAAAALAHGPEAARTLRAFVTLSRAHAELEEALGRRFGEEGASLVGWRARARAEAFAFLAAREEVDGERAVILSGDDQVIAVLGRHAGAWKVELAEADNLAPGAAALERAARGAGEATRAVARRLRAGEYEAPEEALTDWQERAGRAAEEAPRRGERKL